MTVGKLECQWIWILHSFGRNGNVPVVAALAHVDMVIGMNGFLRTTLAAKDLNGTIRDDLIRNQLEQRIWKGKGPSHTSFAFMLL